MVLKRYTINEPTMLQLEEMKVSVYTFKKPTFLGDSQPKKRKKNESLKYHNLKNKTQTDLITLICAEGKEHLKKVHLYSFLSGNLTGQS